MSKKQSVMSKKYKFSDLCIKWAFTKFVEKDGAERPQCVLCYKVMAEPSMQPSKLKFCLSCTHATHQDHSDDMFRTKKARFMAWNTLTQHDFPVLTKVYC